MLKDFIKLSKLFFRIYWVHSIIWLSLQIALIFTLRKYAIVEAILGPIPDPAPMAMFLILGAFIILSFIVLVLFLANTFSCGQRSSWLLRLPYRSSSFYGFPVSIILTYGLSLLFLIPWGPFSAGASIACVGIPVALFLSLKNSSNFLFGIVKSTILGVGLYLLWMYLVYDWSSHQNQLVVEGLALIFSATACLILAKNERKYALVTSGFMGLLLVASACHINTRIPRTFSQATIDHSFNPTEKTWYWFKKIAIDSEYWVQVEQFHLPPFIRNKSQEFIKDFSAEETIRFIENVDDNFKKWSNIDLPKYRPYHFSAFWQPKLKIVENYFWPIDTFNTSKDIADYLYKNWRNSSLFCSLLPFEGTKTYLDKMFHIEECSRALILSPLWSHYSFVDHGVYEELIDQYLLDAYKKSPSKTRQSLSIYLSVAWGLGSNTDNYSKKQGVVFNQNPLSQQLLEKMTQERYLSDLKYLKKMSNLSYQEYVDQINVNYTESRASSIPFLFLCQYLTKDCNEYLNSKMSRKLSLLEAWQYRLSELDFNYESRTKKWIQELSIDPQSWPQIRKLMDGLESRKDL